MKSHASWYKRITYRRQEGICFRKSAFHNQPGVFGFCCAELGFFLNFSNQPTKVLNDGVNGVAIYFILFYHLKIIKFHCLPVRLFISVQNQLFRIARGEIRFGDLSVTLSAVSPSRCSFTTSHFVDGRWSLRSQMSFFKGSIIDLIEGRFLAEDKRLW